MLLTIFLLASVEVADGVVYSWILSVNPVDTDEGKQTNSDNNTKENSTLQNVSTIRVAVLKSVTALIRTSVHVTCCRRK